jgi:hypothetical protein
MGPFPGLQRWVGMTGQLSMAKWVLWPRSRSYWCAMPRSVMNETSTVQSERRDISPDPHVILTRFQLVGQTYTENAGMRLSVFNMMRWAPSWGDRRHLMARCF